MATTPGTHAARLVEPTDAGARSWTTPAGRHVRVILRAEAVAMFSAGVIAYGVLGGAWLAFVPLLIVPDVSMVGYLRNARLGALTYDLGHNLATAGVALGLGLWLSIGWLAIAGAILVVHVGMDRVMGYGLKYPTSFKDTHLQHV